MTASIVRIGGGGVEAVAPESRLRPVRAALRRDQAVRLPSILDAKLLEFVRAKVERAKFRGVNMKYDSRGTAADKTLNAFMTILFTDQRFFRVVESLAGCARIERLTGRLFRTEPNSRNVLHWHGDLGKAARVLSMTVNLGREPVQGGLFQIRRLHERRLLAEFPYDRGGDALLFRVAPDLRHRSTAVTGTAPKLIFTCWFHTTKK